VLLRTGGPVLHLARFACRSKDFRMTEPDYYTVEGEGAVGTIRTAAQARAAHHLASADPETDGTLTGPEHDAKYGLARAAGSAADWASAHGGVETTVAAPAPVTAAAPTPVAGV
jgi:hypothetical protein